jgi:molybdopterin-guanine dinucleotide biosynthesis protein MobB
VAATRILSVIGRKGAGKTTLAIALASEYVRKGRRVMTIKYARQPVAVDREGTDSHRLFHEAKSERTLLVGPGIHALFERRPEDEDPATLARRHFEGADLVLVEGWESAALPKIEVYRTETGPRPIFSPDLPNAAEWIALVTDDDHLDAPCPVLRFRDTMWLQLLANMAWEKAKVL